MVITYTRPSLPALRFESLSPPPAEVLWPDSDEDAGVNVHISKKRRIESLGQQYLQGRPLFIVSAGLRGPLHDEWVNPWAKQKKTGRMRGEGEIVEPITATKVTTAQREHASNALPHNESVATANTQTLVRDQDKGYVSPKDHNALARKESDMAKEAARLVQADKGASCTGFGEEEMSKTLPRGYDLAEALAKHPADQPRPKETSWLKSNTTILRDSSRVHSKSPTPTPTSRPSDDSCLERRGPSRLGFDTSPAASKADAKQPEPPAFPSFSGFTPINKRRPIGIDKESVSKTTPETSTRLVKPIRRKKEVLVDQPPAVMEKTLLQADIETREGFLSAKRLSQEAIRHAEIQDGYFAVKRLSQEAAKRALDASPTPHKGLSSDRRNVHDDHLGVEIPPTCRPVTSERKGSEKSGHSQEAIRHAEIQDGYLAVKRLSQEAAKRALDASPTPHKGLSSDRRTLPDDQPGSETPPAGRAATSERKDSENSHHQTPSADGQALSSPEVKAHHHTNPSSIQAPPHALSVSMSPAGFLYRRTTSGSSSSSLDSTPYPQALEAAKAQAVKRLSFTASGTVKFGPPGSPNAQRSTAKPTDQASPSRQLARKQVSPGKVKTTSKSSSSPATDMLLPKDISDTSSVLADAQGPSRQAGTVEPVQSAPSTNLLETDIQSVKFTSTEERDSDTHFSTQAAVIKAQRSFQTELVSPLKDPSMRFATMQQMQISGPIGSGLSADNTTAAITPFRTFHEANAGALERLRTPALVEVPMSTQAMIDAVTPFTRSTIRKTVPEKKTSFVPSPTEGKGLGNEEDIDGGFGKLGLDMETSPDASDDEEEPPANAPSALRSLSKQSSSIHLQLSPAFSIAPNGTLTEVYQQDGQRPAAEWNLDAVIDDAGSFLGSWDVDNELKRGKISSHPKAISDGSSRK